AGLNKFETGLFIQKFQNHTESLPDEIVEQILIYREKLANKGRKELKAIKIGYLTQLAEDTGIDPQSIVRDYSDTTFRYFSLSGLFSRIGETIVIRTNKRNFVDALLQEEPKFLFNENPFQYFNHFYNNSLPIPTDNLTFALEEINNLKSGIKNKSNPLLREASLLSLDSDPNEVQVIRYRLIEYNNWEREEDYANEQQTDNSIADILRYLYTLNNILILNAPDIDDKPAYLEWIIWRSFLAINDIVCPVHETRRFPIDQDFLPRNTAPGGGSDLVFEFESYVLVVEVTLTTSHRQMSAESEPVRRHAVQYKLNYPDKDVYCLFIAPSVDNNVAETFRIGVWYNGDEEEFVNIIPMSLSDFIISFETMLSRRFSNYDFRILLDRSLIFRNVRAPQWKASITKEVNHWRKRMLS
ncbi:MAG TPA: AlwI family type II restriction endonuclease, partial [Flavobacterium sp.]|nr:AlwI family type II restriction endonuclease [Flavobacterium sp.]